VWNQRREVGVRLKRLIGLIVTSIILLILLATYVAYSDYAEALSSRGSWSVEFGGSVFLALGVVFPLIEVFEASFDSSPEIPSYPDYLSDRFSLSGGSPGQSVADNETFTVVHITVTVSGSDGFDSTLLDEDLNIAYLWAGGFLDTAGKIGTFSYSLGPYVAYHEFSPYKVTATVQAEHSKLSTTEYLTIPDLNELDGVE